MTNKERIFAVLNYEAVDRLPVIQFSYWRALLREWAEQGHISKEAAEEYGHGNAVDIELNGKLGWDCGWFQTESGGHLFLYPGFEYKELSRDAEGFVTYLSESGTIEKKRDGADSIPAEVDYLLKDRKAYEELFKPKLQ
ncbi:MAG: hypothetical protein FWF84_06060, partial [Kiritimatiellaeota bacterium]|nr:hypothetical protein [Kiritimatiellota bacterium]